LRIALTVSRATTLLPIAAWIGISNIWRGISCFSRSVSARPADWALSRWTIRLSASTGSPLTRMSTLARFAGR
jgi:hypothetical protein